MVLFAILKFLDNSLRILAIGSHPMRRMFLLGLTVLVTLLAGASSTATFAFGPNEARLGSGAAAQQSGGSDLINWAHRSTWGDYWARNQAMQKPWHGDYYYLRTGQPTALIVPPTVIMQTNYSWGVSQNTMTPIYHQFGQGPSGGGRGGRFKATPYWPSHTDQFGVYPVRGPW